MKSERRACTPKSLIVTRMPHAGPTGPERGSDATQLGSARQAIRDRYVPACLSERRGLSLSGGLDFLGSKLCSPHTPGCISLEAKHVYPACLTDNDCAPANTLRTPPPIDPAASISTPTRRAALPISPCRTRELPSPRGSPLGLRITPVVTGRGLEENTSDCLEYTGDFCLDPGPFTCLQPGLSDRAAPCDT